MKSERCAWEVDKTVGLSKRLLPVIFKSVPDPDIPEDLRRLQFVRFDTGPGLARPLLQLAAALRQELDWIREHTRLGELAARWQARGGPDSLLLRDDDLDATKAWAGGRKAAAPEITEAQRALLNASDDAETARLDKERARLEEMRRAQEVTARSQKRAGRLLWGVAALVLAMLGGHTNIVWSAAFSPDGKRVVTASHDGTARIWDAERGTGIAVLKGHTIGVTSTAFSSDGKRVVTASFDNTARIWDAERGTEIAVLKGHVDAVADVAFNGDGKRVTTASFDQTALIWDVTWATLVHGETLRERVCAAKLVGAAQEFTPEEFADPILRGIDPADPVARNPCLRRGPLSWEYWARLPGHFRRSVRALASAN